MQRIAIIAPILPEVPPVIAAFPPEVLSIIPAFLAKVLTGLAAILLECAAILTKVALRLLQLSLNLNRYWRGNRCLRLNLRLALLTTLHALLHHLRTGILKTLRLTLFASFSTATLERTLAYIALAKPLNHFILCHCGSRHQRSRCQ